MTVPFLTPGGFIERPEWAGSGFQKEPAFPRLNLGCCDTLIHDWVNVDIFVPERHYAAGERLHTFQVVDLKYAWPWLDSSVDEIKAHDVFEHIADKLHPMNESYRVLKPGGLLDIFIPTTDGRGAWQDPDHKSWWTPNDFFYYQEGNAHLLRFAPKPFGHVEPPGNGVRCKFRIRSQEHKEYADKVWKLRIILEAVK